MTIYSEGLFEKILLDPVARGANKLFIVSGYGSPNMMATHIGELSRRGFESVEVNLVLGMTAVEGLSRQAHTGFVARVGASDYSSNLSCAYVTGSQSVHSKTYVWCKDDEPVEAFIGSANYSLEAFGALGSGRRAEIMQSSDPSALLSYYETVRSEAVDCLDDGVLDLITLFDAVPMHLASTGKPMEDNVRSSSASESVEISLLDYRTMETPTRSGVNHGQRPGRDPSQAYFAVSTDIQRREFFPPTRVQFTVVTDDGQTLLMSRGGDGGKNLMTAGSNSILGKYLRRRIGLAEDAYVRTEDLEHYGRVSISFRKIDGETYFMDFSPR